MKNQNILVLLTLVGIIFISGCIAGYSPSSKSDDSSQSEMLLESDVLIDISDLPSGWELEYKKIRDISEISDDAIALGWKNGFHIGYTNSNKVLQQTTSIYPEENISKVIYLPLNPTVPANRIYEELPNPNIGEYSKAFNVIVMENGIKIRDYYEIVFIKFNVRIWLYISGGLNTSESDYGFLKELVKKVESKITKPVTPQICVSGDLRCFEDRFKQECSSDGTIWNTVQVCDKGCVEKETFINDTTIEVKISCSLSWDTEVEITEGEVVQFVGSGEEVTEKFYLDKGAVIFRSSYFGNDNFIVRLINSEGEKEETLVNTIGTYDGSTITSIDVPGYYRLQIYLGGGSGTWSVKIEK